MHLHSIHLLVPLYLPFPQNKIKQDLIEKKKRRKKLKGEISLFMEAVV